MDLDSRTRDSILLSQQRFHHINEIISDLKDVIGPVVLQAFDNIPFGAFQELQLLFLKK